MDNKVDPTSMTINVSLSEEKYRKTFAGVSKELPGKSKNKQQKNHLNVDDFNYQDLLKTVDEVNAHLTSLGQNILVLINNNNEKIIIKIVDTRNHGVIKQMSPHEFYEVAQNLRNEKLILIDKDA